jgi:hypothetical protein
LVVKFEFRDEALSSALCHDIYFVRGALAAKVLAHGNGVPFSPQELCYKIFKGKPSRS